MCDGKATVPILAEIVERHQRPTTSAAKRALATLGCHIYLGAMPDDLQNLRATLAELHRQLEAAHSLDPDSLAMMRQATADIELALARDGGAAGPLRTEAAARGSVVHRLADAARGFESTHPMLSGAIGSVIDALAQMGI